MAIVVSEPPIIFKTSAVHTLVDPFSSAKETALQIPEVKRLSAAIDDIFTEWETNRIAHGHTWGKWRLDATNLTLNLMVPNPGYYIDLETVGDAAAMLECILHVRRRAWVDNAVVGDLISALDDLFSPQENFCTTRTNRTFDPTRHLRWLLG